MNYALSIFSAVLLILIFPRYDLTWLAPVALMPILIDCTRELSWKRRFLQGWASGFVFWFGHVGATLLTAGGLWTALRLDAVEQSVVNAKDVGPSYGFLAVAGALTYLLAPRLRLVFVGLLIVGVAAVVALSHTFTDFGHLLSLLLGLTCYRIVRGRSTSPIDLRRSFGIRRTTSAPRGSGESAA